MRETEEIKFRKIIQGILKENTIKAPNGEIYFIGDPAYYNTIDGLVMFYDLREKDLKKKLGNQ